ncbi:hypothetical protein HYS97_02470 [Candidatus Daviesbacteria bacterium]|nr:hypothetical protein [Candidatus Daviesbacteria bacterium]
MLDGGDLERRYRRNPIPNPECFTPRKTQLSPALRSSLAEALQGAGDLRDISPDDWIRRQDSLENHSIPSA